jgi:hypothetical protein
MTDNWLDSVVDFIHEVFSFLGSDKGIELIQALGEITLLILKALDKQNTPLTGREKRQQAWDIMKTLSMFNKKEWARLNRLMKETQNASVSDAERDAMIGIMLAKHVEFKENIVV